MWNRWLLCGLLAGSAIACGSDDDELNGDSGLGNQVGDGGSSSDAASAGDGGSNAGGDGGSTGDGGTSSEDCDGLKATIRDFTPQTNPDFQKFSGSNATTGLVKDALGADNKPVFNEAKGQITSATSFSQWYNDVPNVNQTITIPPLPLKAMVGGGFEYDNTSFFPIDGMGFGDYQTSGHNYHFTTEIHTSFTYGGGERFTFRGDDDLWIFVNGKLALDLGGLHPQVEGTIDFDAQAQKLGISKGQTYRMDIFHAERHTVHSNFRISTNIECFRDVVLM